MLSLFQVVSENTMEFATCIVIHDLIIYIAGVVAAQHRAIESSSAEKTFGNFNLNLN